MNNNKFKSVRLSRKTQRIIETAAEIQGNRQEGTPTYLPTTMMRCLRAIRDSSLGLVLYAWLTYEFDRAWQSGKSRKVPWRSIEEQMGCEYSRHSKFRQKARHQLRIIMSIYQDWQLEDVGDCLIIHPSRPAIERRGPSRKT